MSRQVRIAFGHIAWFSWKIEVVYMSAGQKKKCYLSAKAVVKSYNNQSGPAAVRKEGVHPMRGSLQTSLDSLQCLWQKWENCWHKSASQKVLMLRFLADPVHIVPTKPTWSLLITLLEAMALAGCWTDSKSSVQHLICARLENSLEMMQMHGCSTGS